MLTRPAATPSASPGLGHARAGLVVLALAIFAAVTTETAPVGLLPAIGAAFAVPDSTAGLLVSLYAVLVAVLSVPLALATRRIPGKHLLLACLAGYAVGNLVSALAPSLAVLAAGRAIGGVTHALFFSVVIGYTSRLVPAHRTGRALALASSGATAGFVLGVPLATALGDAAGWRVPIAALAVLMLAVAALVAVVLPDVRVPAGEAGTRRAARSPLAAVAGSNALTFLGHFTLYTYVSVLLLRSGAPAAAVGPILFVFGACGLVGLRSAAPRLDRRLRGTSLAVLAVVAAGMAAAGALSHALALVVVAGVVWNGAFGAVASIYQTAAVRTRSASPELAGAWINATANAGIAVGAAVGGAVLDATGIRDVAWLAAALVVLGALVVLLARRAFPQDPLHA